jgi:molecular chaperone HtpG
MTATDTSAEAPKKSKKTTRKFKADVSKVLHLVVNSLYSNREIFLRELISNSSDAIDRIKHRSLTEEGLVGADEEFEIKVWGDEEAGLLHIADNGSGMTRDELITNLGTVAHSGTMRFLEEVETNGGDARFIGQFGVGFYSAFLVADKVTVTTQAPGGEALRWVSDAQESFTIEAAERDGRGTTITLQLAEDHKRFATYWELNQLIRRYSDYVGHPIMLAGKPDWSAPKEDEEAEDGVIDVTDDTPQFEKVNEAGALWTRPQGELEDDNYKEFYKHLTHDWEDPAAWNHFKIEGTQLFSGILFLPKKPPQDMFQRESKRGVRLFVKRVFIMDDAEELVPVWLRFVKGVVDSDDLPLNVSRELLQDSATIRSIRKQISKKSLDMLKKLANDDGEAYAEAWAQYGTVLKEGMHLAPEFNKQLSGLVRWRSTGVDGLTSLEDYVERMPEGQDVIYFALGESESALRTGPHLEALKKRGFEALLMTDPIDEWAINGLGEYDEKKFVSAMKADLDLGETEEEKKEVEEKVEGFKSLTERIKSVLDDSISEVRLSGRLIDSPACLVIPEGANHAFLDRLLRAHDKSMAKTKRILEINPAHALITNIQVLHGKDAESPKVTEWIELLYDQVLLTEGSPVDDPNRLARRMTALLEQASSAAIEAPV